MSFTNDTLKALTPNQTLWDKGTASAVPGLHARCNASGISFLFYYRTKAGVQRRPKVGKFPEVTIAEARRRARILFNRVAVGEDPKGEWDETRKELTVRELFDFAFKEFWSRTRYVKSGRDEEVKGLWKNHLDKNFGSLKLSEIDALKIRSWHQGLHEKPYVANRALEVLSKVFTHAEDTGRRDINTNPCALVEHFPEQSRKRYATPEELIEILRILKREEENFPQAVAFLYLMIFTGSRPSAIERAMWDDLQTYEKDGKTYGILNFHGKSTGDTGEEETMILPPQAMEALNRLPRVPGRTLTGSKMPKRFWSKVKEEVGCGDLWVRDLRRTFATIGFSSGVSLETISELLNHKSTQTTKVYAKLNDQARVAAATAIASQVEKIIQVGQSEQHGSGIDVH